jgi:WD40 repeat protein
MCFNDLPIEVNYYFLDYVGWNTLLALQQTNTHFYHLISNEDAPCWEKWLKRYFPDSAERFYPKLIGKNAFKRLWQIRKQMHMRNYALHYCKIDFLAQAQHAYFCNGLIYAIHSTHIAISDPKEGFSIKKLDLPDVEDLKVQGPRIFTLKKGQITMRDLDSLEVKGTFDCFTKTAVDQSELPYSMIHYRIHRHRLFASFWSGPNQWSIKIWDYEKGIELMTLPLKGISTVFQVNDECIYAGLENGIIEVWDSKGELMQVAGTTLTEARIVHLSFSGNYLISRSSSQSKTQFDLWSLKEGLLVDKFSHSVAYAQTTCVHDGLIYSLIEKFFSYSLQIWDPATNLTTKINPQVHLFGPHYPIYDFYYHDGMIFFAVNEQLFKVLDFTGEEKSASCTLL